MGRGTKHQIILRIKEDFRRLDSKLPFSFSGQGPAGRGWDLKIDAALFETWIFTCRTMALWNRVFPLCPRSRHVPSNLIFKSETLSVLQSYHGRLVPLWAPTLVCG